MGNSDGLHIYGTPDPKQQVAPPAEGMRGERAAPLDDEVSEQFEHKVTAAAGESVEVAETSGTAFVEATGKQGFAEKADDPDNAAHRPASDRSPEQAG
jgi:hypothetical protein